MPLLHEKLNRGMRWITVESCIYEGLILLHYYLLYHAVLPSTYGIIGTAISSIYLVVYRVCGGLEEVVGSFYNQWSASRQSFVRYIVYQYLVLYIILGLFLIGSFWFAQQLSISALFYWLLALTTFLECTKKSMRSLLKILFYNRILAITEITTMIGYCLLVWVPYCMGYEISASSVVWPLCFIAIIGNIVYGIVSWYWYRTLPETDNNSSTSYARIARTAAYSYINQFSTIFFSSNFLVPLIAWHDSIQTAGRFKLISTAINSVTKILDKIFGSSTSAALAQVKEDSLERTRYYFGLISGQLLYVISALLIFSIVNVRALLSMVDRTGTIIWVIVLYLAIMLIDRVATIYERFFIINEKPTYLFIANTSCFIILLISFNTHIFSSPTMLFLALIARASCLCIFIVTAYRKWGIYPTIAINLRHIAGILSASLAFLFAIHAR